MADAPSGAEGYLSIGEVLGILLEEFPDVTISKIRFLESQGLINPERTPSGYRKFYDPDVELLRVILNEQKQNYLPLRVIKDRLETGEIVDPTGEHHRANGSTTTTTSAHRPTVFDDLATPPGDDTDDVTLGDVPAETRAGHPAARAHAPQPAPSAPAAAPTAAPLPSAPPATPQLLPGVLLDNRELCAMVGATDEELTELESFGVLGPNDRGLYDEDAVAILRPAVEFLRAGVDARHLRAFRSAAEREASLYEQLVTPRYRQRNPEARAGAITELRRLDRLGAALRSALTRQTLRKHFEG